MRIQLQIKIFISGLLLLFCVTGNAASFSYSWDIKELAKSDKEQVILRGKYKTIIKRINTDQMRYIYAVKTSMEEVAETKTLLLIVDGDKPNAFAGRIKGNKNVIGINFAMLDLLGMNMHATAALIGHEMAHLKLEHGKDKAKKKFGFTLLKLLGSATLNSLGVGYGKTISDLAFTAIESNYSRDNETEADYLGMIWSIEAGFESDGGVQLHEEMFKASKHHSIPFISSHPTGPERIKKLKGLSKRLSRK